jgi:hypothetical protein
MTNDEAKRVRGLVQLVREGVEHGSAAVERVHLATAGRPFAILERLPGVSAPAKVAHEVHDFSVRSVYFSIRAVSYAVGTTLEAACALLEKRA